MALIGVVHPVREVAFFVSDWRESCSEVVRVLLRPVCYFGLADSWGERRCDYGLSSWLYAVLEWYEVV